MGAPTARASSSTLCSLCASASRSSGRTGLTSALATRAKWVNNWVFKGDSIAFMAGSPQTDASADLLANSNEY